MDIETLVSGREFEKEIKKAVSECRVLIAMIGEQWLDIKDEEDKRRLDNKKDFVRLEIETALEQGKTVIPIFLGTAELPKEEKLPGNLKKLLGKQIAKLRPEQFRYDMALLIDALEKVMPPPPPLELPPGEDLVFTVTMPQDGQQVRNIDSPLRTEGKYAVVGQVQIWVVLEDIYGQYYLQNPPVKYLPDGKWVARNVLPGERITAVHFVRVDTSANAYFKGMMKSRFWGAFDELPEGNEILQSVEIERLNE